MRCPDRASHTWRIIRNVEIHPGQTIYTPPGEWHWHGATPTHFMEHLAMWEAIADGPETTWGEHVTDAEYTARR